jgi:hypothetical protein
MDGTRVLIVALLFCLTPIGGGVAASDTVAGPFQTDETPDRSMTVVADGNTSEYLAPPPEAIDRTGTRTAGIDVAGAIEADTGQLRSVYLHETLREQYRSADTDTERRAVVERGVGRFSDRTETLEAKQREAIRQFNDGSMSERELLRTLATVHREAEATMAALRWLETIADDIGMAEAADRAATERVRLVPMEGPVRERLSNTFEGGPESRIYVETAGGGVVLATVGPIGDTYLREAYDPTAKRTDVPDRYGGDPSPALERFTELYPWTIQSFDAIDAMGPSQVRLYRFRANHPHGELETYLDSGSTDILYEIQRNDLASIPTETATRTAGELRLLVNVTRPGGPLGVSAVDATTGDPVDATVEINGEPIGSTDGEQLWTVAPRGAATVNATYGGEAVTFETRFD